MADDTRMTLTLTLMQEIIRSSSNTVEHEPQATFFWSVTTSDQIRNINDFVTIAKTGIIDIKQST